jgi:S1-C subfamily serine protease
MLLLAANLLIGSQLSSSDFVVWNRVQPAIAYMRSRSVSVGAAAFIDKEGYAVTHNLTLARTPTDLVTSTGQALQFRVVHRDTASQLVLIKTEGIPAGIATLDAASTDDAYRPSVFAVLAHGPAKAELTNAGTIGVDESSRRSVPMSVVRIEQSISPIGGGLLISDRGRLMGAFAATLATGNQARNARATANGASAFNSQTPPPITAQRDIPKPVSPINLGPQGMVIGYSPTWEVVAKAIQGFKSPEHKAAQGMLGLFVVDAPQGGLLVKSFFEESPAKEAGLEIGDVIVLIGDTKMRNQMDFARVTYRLIPGSNIVISVKRGDLIKNLMVRVGTQLTAVTANPGLSTASLSRHDIR